ncbi:MULTISPECIES: lipopolysaccharide biosynthesis protein [unclassified Sphingomonas]|uniref:lipopolysaccharide biosynthesis protein n=1 Tax=unclassified Sphingomonas TaxID=196159 RepID=UPI00285EE37E|nr:MULTISPECIES: lipopolysaccharide biosynthesis protein [unclassified Sphingomonas]MDR6116758.1 capsular polysaccharide transport system permease protein [Sphingomonas sp. SORGH_AS_0789]MDR6151904.1 capsular polysaccharide transport system permease protein [Sphingomonas sp. SORGH_AS_0742]
MNMHGIIAPSQDDLPEERPTLISRIIEAALRRRMLMLIVVLPTLLVTGYYYLIASDQYESEAHFLVKSAEGTTATSSGFGQLFGISGIGGSGGEAASVADYLRSHDAVAQLRKSIGLVELFRRPEADLLSRLNTADPTPERLLKYYDGKVSVTTDHDTGITTLAVRAFRPTDSYMIIHRLLDMGERRVNEMNARSYKDAIASSQRQLADAEKALAAVQGDITDYRQSKADVDPEGSGKAQIGLVSTLRANLAAAQAQLETTGAFISHSSPQYIALSRQVQSLRAQLAAQSNRLAGETSNATIASNLGGYEDLRLRQEFAGKRYEAAAATLAQAQERAQRQQLYLVRVVDANLPVKSLFPQRAKIVLTVFFGLMLVYSIGWLIAAGVREHAA